MTTRYGRTIGRKDGAYNPSTGTTIKWSNLMATKVDDDDITEVIKWIPGSENEADIFTKNLDGPIFKRYAVLLLGEGSVGGKGGDTK